MIIPEIQYLPVPVIHPIQTQIQIQILELVRGLEWVWPKVRVAGGGVGVRCMVLGDLKVIWRVMLLL